MSHNTSTTYKAGFAKFILSDCMDLVVPETRWQASSDGSLEKKFDISDRVTGIWRPIKGEVRKLVKPLELSILTGTDSAGRWFLIAIDVCEIGYKFLDSIRKPIAERYNIDENRILCMPSHCHINLGIDNILFGKMLLDTAEKAVQSEKEFELASINLNIDAEKFVINRRVHIEGLGTRTIMFNDGCTVEDDSLVVTSQIKAWISNLGGNPGTFIGETGEIRTSRNVDSRLQALVFRDSSTKNVLGSIVRFACHPVIVSEKKINGEVSADYPGYLREKLTAYFGGVTMFAQGQCGDLRPLIREYSHSFAASFGEKLADKIIAESRNGLHWEKVTHAEYTTEPCVLPLRKDFPSGENEASQKMKDIETQFDKETDIYRRRKLQNLYWFYYRWKVIELVRPEWVKMGTAPLHVTALKLNNSILLANQAEVFSDIARKMVKGFEQLNPITVGICNEQLSYIPSKEDFERGGYEPSVCLTEPGSTEIIIKSSQSLLNRVVK